jgi:hypothetical protein
MSFLGKSTKGHDGWEETESPIGVVHFFRGGCFDICVWKADHYTHSDGKSQVHVDSWGMSCHRQFGFSCALPDAKDERTAKLMALAVVDKRCREGAYRAALAIKEVADSWAEKDKDLRPWRETPLGKPSKKPCANCKATPTMPLTGLCGPCTFNDPSTAGGNW